jgi:hypothetical protein
MSRSRQLSDLRCEHGGSFSPTAPRHITGSQSLQVGLTPRAVVKATSLAFAMITRAAVPGA